MAISQANAVVQHLHGAVFPRDEAGATDGQLLERFVGRRDEAALAILVRRHAPMVWGVCRRILRNHHDAEDAFQTTFLVLVRKASSVVPREMLANWLHGVAHQTALKARVTAARRKQRETQVTEMPEAAVADRGPWRDLQPILDEELRRLPAKYRVVLVLCELEGKSRKETALQLAVPEGTVSGRLARARVMLAKRLSRRGVALSGGALAAILAENTVSAGVPTSVVSSTVKTTNLVSAGQAIASGVSLRVAALTEGVLKAMLTTKLKQLATVLLLLIGSLGACAWLYPVLAAAPPTASPSQTDADKPSDPRQKSKPIPADKDAGSGLPPGSYTGACQVMQIDPNGAISYPDAPPPAICHIEIEANGNLVAEFPDKKLGRGKWDTVTLKLSAKEPRVQWTGVHNGDSCQATAIPYSPQAYIFRLEIFTNGKLVAGAQQFFALTR